MTHKSLIDEILLRYARRPGMALWAMNTGAAMLPGKGGKRFPVRFGMPGQADITGIRKEISLGVQTGLDPVTGRPLAPTAWQIADSMITCGQRIEIECKVGRDKQRPLQVEFQKMIEDNGGLYILARSIEDVAKVLGR